MASKCPNNCFPFYAYTDNTKGETYCSSCGALVDRNQLTTELDFNNNKAVGTFTHNGNLRGKKRVVYIKISCIAPGGLESGEFRLYKAQE